LIKGPIYLNSLGPEYWVRLAFYIIASAIAIRVESQRFHLAYAVVALIGEGAWALSLYDTLV
jgi:hypothetical protein